MMNERGKGRLISQFAEFYSLTETQKIIFELLIFNGYSNDQLSDHLNRSYKTIANHMFEILRKTQTCSSREVMSLFINFAMEREKSNQEMDSVSAG